MLDLKRILKRLPKYDNPDPATAKTEQEQVLAIIAQAVNSGEFTYTSRRSIRIYLLLIAPNDTLEARSVEVEWRLND